MKMTVITKSPLLNRLEEVVESSSVLKWMGLREVLGGLGGVFGPIGCQIGTKSDPNKAFFSNLLKKRGVHQKYTKTIGFSMVFVHFCECSQRPNQKNTVTPADELRV